MKKTLISFLAWCGLASAGLGAGGPPVVLDWGVVDTSGAAQQTQSRAIRAATLPEVTQQVDSRGGAPWLVQFGDVIQEEWKTALVEAGAVLKGYIPENAFLIEATPAVVAKIGAMSNVTWVGEYLPAYKKSKPVRQMLAKGVEETREYNILLFRAEDRVGVARAVAELSGAFVTVVEELPDGGLVRAILPAAALETVSGWGEVQWVEPYSKPRLWNNVATRTNLMNVSNVWSVLGLTGAGQTIAVADTGLDSGNTSTLHPDFTNRVTGFGWSNGAYSASYSWADLDAHGTHVSGSVLGNGTMSAGLYKGVAYEANLIIQGTQTNLSGIPSALATLFKQAFDNGARIHSDSWGYDDHGYYNTDSRALDQFVWSNKTMLILVAAGNSGTDSNTVDGVIDPMSVASPATAKNCMTVGAAENYRTTGGYSGYTWGSAWPDDYSTAPVSADYVSRPMSNNIQGMAAFSSRGPCNDGRIKPDIVAPGTDIISTRSRRASGTGWGTVSGNTNYLYEGGTSMATPLTAGAAGLTRQWVMTTGGVTNPSGQLLKALMLNGARDMSPGQYNAGTKQEIGVRPEKSQGWGHVDLFNTLQPATNQFLALIDTNSLTTGQTNTFTYAVNTGSTNKFILTMAYADYWGTAGSGKQLVNDLDLTVQKPSGTTVYANNRTNVDATNNVEMVEFAADEAGTYTVRVVGRTVPSGGSQAYALVVRGPKADETPSAPAFGANPGPVSATVGAATNFTVATTNGYPVPVLALRTTTASSGYSFTAGSGLLAYTPPMGDGGYTRTFTFTASNSSGVATQTVSVVVAESAPAAPASVWASATNATDFTAAWSAVSGAASYALDVATNSSFSGGGGVGTNLVAEGFASATPSGWTISAGGTYSSSPYVGTTLAGTYSIKFSTTGNSAVSPAFSTGATNLQFWAYGNGTGTASTFVISGLVNSAWTRIATSSIAIGAGTYNVALDAQTTQIGFYFTKNGYNCALDDVIVQAGGGGSPSYVAGYSNRTVAGTSQSVTGLASGATYYFRARAVNAAGSSPNSPTGSVATTGGVPGTPPVLGAIAAQSATVNVDFEYTVTATATDGDPILSYACTTAVSSNVWDFDGASGYLYFLPESAQIGANEFSFTATDKDGTCSPVSMTVTVSAASTPPSVSFGSSRVVAEEGGSAVTLPVNLSFAADATVQVAIAGTALNGTDFNCSTTLLFLATGPASSNWVLSVVEDSLAEGPESAGLRLNPVAGATLGSVTQAVFFIRDNDAFSILAGNLTSGTSQKYEEPGSRILETLCPDVALLQEFLMTNGVTYRAWVNEHFGSNFYYFVESTNGDSAAAIPNGIVSRWPITASNEWEDANLSNRDFAWAKIDLPGARDLYAVSVHLKADSGYESDRTAQARALTNNIVTNGWLTNGYVVIGGDFNLQNRSETALSVLTAQVVSDARQPADQLGDKDTNSGRDNPYDLVLPSTNLNARHRTFSCYGYAFTNGMVFDTRIAWASGLPPPARTNDSGATNMQHMAVVKVFELEPYLEAPSGVEATPAGSAQIDLSWNLNSVGDSVIVVWNSTGSFSSPTGSSPAVGAAFAGGTVLYKGTATSVSHTGLSGCSSYSYRVWSTLGTNYSAGVDASASTTGPDAPSTVWVSATNNTDFTAAWSAVDGISSYRLDVSTGEGFGAEGNGIVYTADFEDASKAGFAAGDVVLNGLSWNLNEAVIGTTSGSDRFNGLKSARARSNETVNAGILGMNSDTNMGLSSITLQYAVYGTDGSSSGRVDYSSNSGSNWISAGTFAATSTNLTLFAVTNLNITGNVRVRVVKTSGTSARYNIDDITLYPYASTGEYVAGYSNRTVSGATSLSVTGLTAGVTYVFRVRAADGSCESGNSSTGQVTTRAQDNQAITAFLPTNGSVWVATNVVGLSAAASSGLPVAFAVESGPATLSGGTNLAFTGAGSVVVVASQPGNANWNPAPDVTNTLTVVKATAGVALNGLAQAYNGSARTVTATTTPGGLSVGITYDGSGTAPVAVGSYAVTGTVSEALYQGSASGTLVVSKANSVVTVWPTASGLTYGQTLADSTLSGGSATPAGTFAFTAPSAVPGGGTAAQGVTYSPTDTANYNEATGSVSVSVSPVPLTATADPQIKPFGATNPVLTVHYEGFVLGQTAGALSTEPAAGTDVNETTPVGIYAGAITVSGGVSENYTFSYVPADFTVTEAIESAEVASNDVELVVGSVEAGQEYDLMYRPSLTTGEWSTVDTVTGGGETNATLTHGGGGANEAGYYRIDGAVGPSAEVWGFVKMDKPESSKLAMVGVPFSTEEQTLNSLMDPAQFSGQRLLPGSADQVMIWDAGAQKYVNLAMYQWGTNRGWKASSGFGPAAPYTNPVLPAGSAFWFRGATNSTGKLTVAGGVVMNSVVTNPVVGGLQLVANPFSDAATLNDLGIHQNARGQRLLPGSAEQVMIWDAKSQAYVNLALYEWGTNKGWKAFSGFGPAAPYTNPVIPAGQGFWLRSVSGSFNWVGTNRYRSGLE